jgi:Fic family protein
MRLMAPAQSVKVRQSRKSRLSSPSAKQSAIWQLQQWPAFTWRVAAVEPLLAQSQQVHARLVAALQALGFAAGPGIAQDLWTQDALATAAIEGQNLDLAAVRSSVGRRLGFGVYMSDDRDAEGLVRVMADACRSAHSPLDESRLCQWQSWLFPGNADRPAKLQIALGEFRSHAEPMQIIGGILGRETVYYTAPPSAQVGAEMKRLLQWLQGTSPSGGCTDFQRPPPLIRAAVAHLWFESIHPFEDGNGRVGRALADYVLAQETGVKEPVFSLSRQILQERKAYYTQLQTAQHARPLASGGIDVTDWVAWFLGVFQHGCEHSLRVIAHAQDAAAFWQTAARHGLNAREHKVLEKLLAAGSDSPVNSAQAGVPASFQGGFQGGLSADKYMQITGCSKATATRDLARLHAAGLLRVRGMGKATRYAVAVPGWNLQYL